MSSSLVKRQKRAHITTKMPPCSWRVGETSNSACNDDLPLEQQYSVP